MVCPPPHPFNMPSLGVNFFLIVLRLEEGFSFFFFRKKKRPQTWMPWILATGLSPQVPRPQLVATFPTTVVLGVTCLAAPLG